MRHSSATKNTSTYEKLTQNKKNDILLQQYVLGSRLKDTTPHEQLRVLYTRLAVTSLVFIYGIQVL